jgi:hypothetical protein
LSKNSSVKHKLQHWMVTKQNLTTTQRKIDTTFGDLKKYTHLQCTIMQT